MTFPFQIYLKIISCGDFLLDDKFQFDFNPLQIEHQEKIYCQMSKYNGGKFVMLGPKIS